MKRERSKRLLHDLVIAAGLLALTTGLAFILFYYVSDNPANIPLLYMAGIITTAYGTNGYFSSILASIFGTIFINCFFTHPYFHINFSRTESSVSFLCTLAFLSLTGIGASHIKQQAKILSTNEKQLMAAEKEKIRANLLRAVSHDLRTPLTGILGASASLEENWDSYETDERLELIHNIHDDADWLLNMVENLLSVTHIQSKNSKLNMSLEVLDDIVAESVTRLKKRFPEAEINVTLPAEIVMVPMDAMLIEQVLINLMENALIHSHSTQPICLIVEEHAADAYFRVIDHGIGLGKEHLEQIFDGTYTQTISSDGHKGMGIGLSLCKSIITAHHGSISARNHSNGAEFLFTLPKEESHE